MYYLITILIIIVCVLLVLVVLIQNSKGGGLAANFSSNNQFMGVRKTTDFVEKATWTLAISLLVLCLVASWVIPREARQEESRIKTQVENAVPNQNAIPSMPTTQEGVQQTSDKPEE